MWGLPHSNCILILLKNEKRGVQEGLLLMIFLFFPSPETRSASKSEATRLYVFSWNGYVWYFGPVSCCFPFAVFFVLHMRAVQEGLPLR